MQQVFRGLKVCGVDLTYNGNFHLLHNSQLLNQGINDFYKYFGIRPSRSNVLINTKCSILSTYRYNLRYSSIVLFQTHKI